jgi:hypothetical protein
VLIERPGTRNWSVTKGGEVLLEAVVGDASSLFEAWHAFSDFDVDVTIVDKVKEERTGQ